jgi:hypothetical protein
MIHRRLHAARRPYLRHPPNVFNTTRKHDAFTSHDDFFRSVAHGPVVRLRAIRPAWYPRRDCGSDERKPGQNFEIANFRGSKRADPTSST